MEISQGTRFVVALMVAATPLGRFGSAGGHRFGGGIRGLGPRWLRLGRSSRVEFSHS
jgi:hypothetical protein